MEQSSRWFLPMSERYSDANPANFASFSTSYVRQPYEATHACDPGLDAQSADSSLQPTTYPVPRLQDDEYLVKLGNSELSPTPEFEKSYCQRILFVWRTVFHLCWANHDLALRTWVQLLDGEGGDDIWLWVDGDEEHIGTSNLHRVHPYDDNNVISGWKLTNSDFCMGISALVRHVERIRGGVSENLYAAKRRERLQLVHPLLRFAAITWSICTSEAMRRADASRGTIERCSVKLFYDLEFALEGLSLDMDFMESTMRSKFRGFWNSRGEAGHTCHIDHGDDVAVVERWIYIKSLVAPNFDIDVTFLGIVCDKQCASTRFEASFRWYV
jgi:hypothetical protein